MKSAEKMINKLSLPIGGKILCAVSGGADSMCLLHMLISQGRDVIVAHFDHGIRGAESLRDADFVADWCRERGIICVVGHGDVPGYAKANSLGTEEAARALRYEFLQRTAGEYGCDYIATAHNADDNVETVLFNLTRGTGALGLRGIPRQRDNFIRPMLDYSRAEIEEYLKANGIDHVEDSTNLSDDYSRNLIRHHVTPMLRQINPGLNQAVARTAGLIAQDEDCLNGLAQSFIDQNYDGDSLPVDKLRALHPAIASRVVRSLCSRSLSQEHVSSVLELLNGTELKYIDLPGTQIRREQGRIYFGSAGKIQLPTRRLVLGQWIKIPELGIELFAEFKINKEEINGLFKTYSLKCENINSELFCSGRQNGDKLRPAGRGCTKSLKSLFLEAGYSQRQRDSAVVIRDEKGILAVLGLCIAERAKPEPGKPILTIRTRKI
jgi:tRNA(Ile)-lysidine synthase